MKNCNICGSQNNIFHEILRDYPITNLYSESSECGIVSTFDINIYQCICGHVFSSSQHTNIYNNSYAYNGMAEGVQFRRRVGISMLQDTLGSFVFNCLIDIGGGQLEMIKEVMSHWETERRIVIDPVPIKADDNETSSIEFLNEYFDGENFEIKSNSNPSLYILDNVLEHIQDLNNFMNALEKSSHLNDFIYVCVPSLEVIYEKIQFQEIIHEHINYFSVAVVNKLFQDNGFECVKSFTDYQGYRGYNYHLFKKSKATISSANIATVLNFESGFNYYRNMLNSTLKHIENINKPIYGVCASELTPTLAYHMGSDLSFCKNIYDTSLHKHNKYMPLIKPKIVAFDGIKNTSKDSYFYITAPAVAKKVVSNLTLLGISNIILPVSIL